MNEPISLWLIFALIGLATVLPRSSFIVLAGRARLPPWLQRALRYAPAAALAAIILPDLLVAGGAVQPANPRLLAGLVVVAVVLWSRNPWLPFIAGMGVLSVLHFGLGW
ncbi:MAG: AzlD domain-containing protein [Janthinobacterium lividum]